MGMALLAMAEYGWVTTRGLSLRLDRSMVQTDFRSLVTAGFHAWGTSLSRQLEIELRPSIQQQVSATLQHLSVSVDGVAFGIPTEAQLRLRHRLSQIANRQLHRYIQAEMRPTKMIDLLFPPNLTPHWFVFKIRDHGMVIPLHIYVK